MAPEFACSSALINRIVHRTASVCVIGQGYVGLSVASAAAAAGMDVVGVDLDAERVKGLARGRLVVPGVMESVFAQAYGSGRIRFSTEPVAADITLICVPTPILDHRPDLSAIEAAGGAVASRLRAGDLVVLESTTYPGTTEQVLQPLLESSGLRAGTDFLLAYSPERIDPGNPKFDLANTPRVVGGISREATEAAAAFYAQLVDDVMTVSSCRAAEFAKLLENTFRMVNIALVNELAVLCWEQGTDPWEVIDAAASKPFGYMPFYPGPGVGGHCIPLDPVYLAWQSRRDAGRPYRLVELARDINAEMPTYVASRIAEALNDRGRAVNGARILVLGVTYKENVGDTRESAAVQVLLRLHRKGARISFHDPFIERIEDNDLHIERVTLDRQALEGVDLVALLTPHAVYDLAWIVDRAPLVFDARNALRAYRGSNVVIL
jgi:UDP-N-acetyl-D-glucosamine dehydrogenase